jgi:tRNA A-37 threonylcarbamoyl transferase component Bud32
VAQTLTTRAGAPTFADLPWQAPLETWVDDRIVTPARGISRHVVRFVAEDDVLYAIKELPDRLVEREYRNLRALHERGVPVVPVVGMVTGRRDTDADELDGVIITEHLTYSLPYRIVISRRSTSAETRELLLDALAQLLVRIHLAGFFWGDCSLSNTLFRRDAGRLVAYLVDTETGELHEELSSGQRRYDLEVARENICGELLDLVAAGQLVEGELDPIEVVDALAHQYEALWDELTREECVPDPDRHWVNQRVQRLNELGFDVDELELVGGDDGWRLRFQAGVVEPGHHRRQLLALTGLDVEENQARRMLNDIALFGCSIEQAGARMPSPNVLALRWLTEAYEPALERIPEDLRDRLEPAELYHQLLEHRWFLAERAGHDVGMEAVVDDYVETVLSETLDERTVMDPATAELPVVRTI